VEWADRIYSHKAKVITEVGDLDLADITIHICHKDDLVACSLPCGYGHTKVTEEGAQDGQESP